MTKYFLVENWKDIRFLNEYVKSYYIYRRDNKLGFKILFPSKALIQQNSYIAVITPTGMNYFKCGEFYDKNANKDYYNSTYTKDLEDEN